MLRLAGCAVLIATLVLPSGSGAVTFQEIGVGAALSISSDGTVIAGNTDGTFETFRWTQSTGIVPLGRSTTDVFGSGAGTPDISDDGSRISATIADETNTFITQGRWTDGSGWEVTMPPLPPDGGLIDNAYGSAWGLSGNGEVLVGLYWRPGMASTGLAHACKWTSAGGLVDLGSSGGNSRANDANSDGSVIVGWDENPSFGNWRPTVWVDGVLETLTFVEGFAEASCVNDDGTIIGGQTFDVDGNIAPAAVWRWDGAEWVEEVLGTLPGTAPPFGLAVVNDMTPDGSRMVGYNRFSNPANATGFIWSEETGMIDLEEFLDDNGITYDSTLDLLSLTGISDDGMVACGIAQRTTFPFPTESFVITLDTALSVPPGSVSTPAFVSGRPNPTSGSTILTITLPSSDRVTLDVYDVNGRLVRKLLTGGIEQGTTSVAWDGRNSRGVDVPAGVYYYRLSTSGGHHESHRLVMIR